MLDSCKKTCNFRRAKWVYFFDRYFFLIFLLYIRAVMPLVILKTAHLVDIQSCLQLLYVKHHSTKQNDSRWCFQRLSMCFMSKLQKIGILYTSSSSGSLHVDFESATEFFSASKWILHRKCLPAAATWKHLEHCMYNSSTYLFTYLLYSPYLWVYF